MSDVAELEKRISAALDRIGKGLGALTTSGQAEGSAELNSLQELLESEKTVNSQLKERVTAIKNQQDKLVSGLEGEVEKLRNQLSSQDGEIQKIKQTNLHLRENNQALRDANLQGIGDEGLINGGMLAELDALRVSRETDRAELDSILMDLKPLIEGAANA